MSAGKKKKEKRAEFSLVCQITHTLLFVSPQNRLHQRCLRLSARKAPLDCAL